MKYLAQNQIKDYTPLTPLPDVRTGEKTTGINELPGYLPNMFNLVIGLAAVIAVGWLIWGGVEYITTDSWTGKEEGKARIKNAIIGLLIIVMSWFILFTINPRLLTLNLNIASTPIQSAGSVTAGTTATTPTSNPCTTASLNCIAQQTIEKQLKDKGILLNTYCTAASCPTQVVGLTQASITDLESLKSSCNCVVKITGGTELAQRDSTSTHLQGISVDLAVNPQLNTYLGVTNPVAGQTYTVTINGKETHALYEVTGTQAGGSTSSGTHWHITLPQ